MKKLKIRKNANKGITLIALVITIWYFFVVFKKYYLRRQMMAKEKFMEIVERLQKNDIVGIQGYLNSNMEIIANEIEN